MNKAKKIRRRRNRHRLRRHDRGQDRMYGTQSHAKGGWTGRPTERKP